MNRREAELVAQRAKVIERALAAKRWTQLHLGSKTGYDERTIRNVLRGRPVREQTILDVCQALGIEAELHNGHQVDFADQHTASIRAGRIANTKEATSPIAAASAHRLA